MVPCLNSDYKGETFNFQSGSLPAAFGRLWLCLNLKTVPCWVLDFCDKIFKNLFKTFSFYEIRMRTCYARPMIVYILSREDRLILRRGKFCRQHFYFSITVMTASLFPCWVFEFWFWFPAKHISIAQFLSSWHILNVRWLVQFLFISRLFKVHLGCLFLGCHPCLWDLWLSFLFSKRGRYLFL